MTTTESGGRHGFQDAADDLRNDVIKLVALVTEAIGAGMMVPGSTPTSRSIR